MTVRTPALVLLLATFAALKQPPESRAQRVADRHQAFMAITVADLDASVRWYETNLGARRIAASRAPSEFAENATMAELLHFAAKAPTDTAVRDPRAVGLQKAGMWVDATTFDSTLARLRRLDAVFVGGVFSDSIIKGRSFIVKDNSGVLIQFFTPIP